MTTAVVILGAGGFAREVLDVYDAFRASGHDVDLLGFVVDGQYGRAGELVNGVPVLGDFEWLGRQPSEIQAICAVGDPALRRRMVDRTAGRSFASIVHPTAVIGRSVTIGAGVVITAGCILTNQISIRDHVHVNLSCTLGHDAVLEDFVTLSPGVHVSGGVRIRQGASVGTGVAVIERREIGAWSIVGAGSVVVADVPANSTVVGVPARVIKTRPAGWQLNG